MSFLPKITQKSTSLPLITPSSTTADPSSTTQSIRRRLPSLSLNSQGNNNNNPSSAASIWTFRRSKSLSSMGETAGDSIKKWWEWGWGWILSRKPSFATDLEMNEEEKQFIGVQSRGSWKHVFYKIRCEIRRILRSDDKVGLPQTFRYDSCNYSKNFDDGQHLRRTTVVMAH